VRPSKYVDEVKSILASIDEPDKDSQEQRTPDASDTSQPIQEVDVYIEPDRITFIPKTKPQEHIIESTPAPPAPQKPAYLHIYILSFTYVFLLLSILILQLWLVFHPPIATITLVARSQTVTLTGTLQLGRVIAPITLSQSATAPTTGKGHQPARSAVGTITFYNGLFTSQTIQAGTILTGSDGVEIIIDQDAFIPAANPPSLGYATVSTHAIHAGSNGNIPAYDINQGCCATAIKVVNTTSFTGGQDARDFRTVTKNDIHTVSTLLKTTLAQGVIGALQAQLKNGEALKANPCSPTVTPDHQVGAEATQVKVTVSLTCSAIAYNSQELTSKVTALLADQAIRTLGTGYSLLGEIHITVTQATTQKQAVVLAFSGSGTWVYALTAQDQEHVKILIAGKSKQEALELLQGVPGIERASITWEGKHNLPTDTRNIHINIFVG
jgi:hypothetical protein